MNAGIARRIEHGSDNMNLMVKAPVRNTLIAGENVMKILVCSKNLVKKHLILICCLKDDVNSLKLSQDTSISNEGAIASRSNNLVIIRDEIAKPTYLNVRIPQS